MEKIKKHLTKILVVNDCSTDKTGELAREAGAEVLNAGPKADIGKGKGNAIRIGSEYCIAQGAESFIYIDGDMQHDPDDIPAFLNYLRDKDVVISFRDMDKEHMPYKKKLGNFGINKLFMFIFLIGVRDSQCGYKAMRKEAYEKMGLEANGYFIESEIILKIKHYKLSYAQIPIATRYLDEQKGTNIGTGFKIVKDLVYWRFKLWGIK